MDYCYFNFTGSGYENGIYHTIQRAGKNRQYKLNIFGKSVGLPIYSLYRNDIMISQPKYIPNISLSVMSYGTFYIYRGLLIAITGCRIFRSHMDICSTDMFNSKLIYINQHRYNRSRSLRLLYAFSRLRKLITK